MPILSDIENIGLNPIYKSNMDGSEIVVARVKHKVNQTEKVETEGYVPGLQSIFIETWGCSHNNSDSEYMAGLLSKYGFTVYLQGSSGSDRINDKLNSDLWLLNSCTVKSPAEDHFRNMIAEARKYNKKLVVAGCVPQGQPKAPYLKGVSVVGVHQIDRVVEVVEETLKGHSVQLYAKKREAGRRLGGASLSLPKIRKNPRIEILPVNSGCLNACTYCKTKHARGDLGSYPMTEILNRVTEAFNDGCVEIWLTSEDLGAYGRDLGTSLPDLLDQMVTLIPGGCMLRLGMTNPPYILEHLPRIAAVLKHPRVYSFLHVPVQSGSNNVLGEMKREYTREDFCHVVDTLYREIGPKNMTIATDIICGFPTETDADFQETVTLVDRYRFPVLFNNQFYPRPGTPASKMDRCATTFEVKKRTKLIHDLFHSYNRYHDRIGHEMNVLVTEESPDGQHFVGHTKAYEQVLLCKEEKYLGKVVRVRIIGSSKHSMKAIVIGEEKEEVKEVCEEIWKQRMCTTEKTELSSVRISVSTALMSRIVGGFLLSFLVLKIFTLITGIA